MTRTDGEAGAGAVARADQQGRILTVPNAISVARLAGVPVFLWLVLGPQAGLAGRWPCSSWPGCPTGWTARSPARWNQTSRLGAGARPGRRPALHRRHAGRAGRPGHHPLVAGRRAGRPRAGARRGAAAVLRAARVRHRCRSASSARPPRCACCTRSRCCSSASHAGRRRRWRGSSAGRSRSGEPPCTGGPPCCTWSRSGSLRQRRPSSSLAPRRVRDAAAVTGVHIMAETGRSGAASEGRRDGRRARAPGCGR